ncbi:unnamed protein product [Adineta ricciae]|uniref:Uncharacterized protein n=1 Tax=Adineta ricciae TaxID=249248 RepID=A0A815WFZ6_ADIRI|nr:unnamed protein product [Adineta ricciae]CAF1582225.1 unnamed protein product [Adineta ricciae]
MRKRGWCAHPRHVEVLPNGKRRYWKTGPRPSHPQGRRAIPKRLAVSINSRNESILNGTSKKLSEDDYLCSSCFAKEEKYFVEALDMDIACENPPITPVNNGYIDVKEDARQKLNQVLQCVGMERINEIRNTNQIANAVDEIYFRLHEWRNVLLPLSQRIDESETLSSLDLSMGDAIWILRQLRQLFAISDKDEQKRLMTMLPENWGRDRIANWFNGSGNQARRALKIKSATGILSRAEDQRGNRPLDNQTKLAVHNYYNSDEVSRETSYKKQVIHPPPSRVPIPLRFLHLTIGETFQKFKIQYPDVPIKKSKFYELRPAWVKERTPHDSCLCMFHENANLLLQAISKSLDRLITIKTLLEQTICSSPSEQCYYRQCDGCRTIKASDILSNGIDVEVQDECSWSIWKKVQLRYELLHVTGAFQALLGEIDSLWSNFITHTFNTSQQRDYIAMIKELSSFSTYAIVQLDFAQNFSFVIQREIQSGYYCRQQATIFTVYIRIGDEHRNMVIISNYLAHDTRFVYSAQKIIIEFLKKEYRTILKVNYVSDGATGHFKNRYNMHNLAHHYQDFHLVASWTFSSTGHGKGPCDGLGAVIKFTATHYLLRGGPQVSFASPEDFYNWCFQRNDRMVIAKPRPKGGADANSISIPEPNRPIEVRWLPSDTITKEFEEILTHRWNSLSTKDRITGIRDYHEFAAGKDGSITLRRVSQSTKTILYKFRSQVARISSINQVVKTSDLQNDFFVLIKLDENLRLAQIKSLHLAQSQLTVSCFDPPFPASSFYSAKSPYLSNLTIPIEIIQARFIDNSLRATNGNVRISSQQFIDIHNFWDDD